MSRPPSATRPLNTAAARFASSPRLSWSMPSNRKWRRQGRADRRKPDQTRFGNPRRTGIPAVQRFGRGVAVPPAEQALRMHQRRNHHKPELQRVSCLSSQVEATSGPGPEQPFEAVAGAAPQHHRNRHPSRPRHFLRPEVFKWGQSRTTLMRQDNAFKFRRGRPAFCCVQHARLRWPPSDRSFESQVCAQSGDLFDQNIQI